MYLNSRAWIRVRVQTSLLLFFAVAVSACASSSQGTPQSSASAQVAPVDGGTVAIPIPSDPTLIPMSPNARIESNQINRILFQSLTKPGKDLAPSPSLATSWEASSDGLAWTFHLRSGVKWSDGQPFTADDVAFTFNDIMLKKEVAAQRASNFAPVQRVDVVDPSTVRFILRTRLSSLPAYLGFDVGIVPKHVLASAPNPLEVTSFNKGTPVTTGPYKVSAFQSGVGVTLVRNENFYGAKPHLDKIIFKIVPDENAQVAQLLSGDLDVAVIKNPDSIARLQADTKLAVKTVSDVRFWRVDLNQSDARFQDVRVRQAFMYALDRPGMVKALAQGLGRIGNSPTVPALQTYYDSSLESLYPYDPNKAKQLLGDAGWLPGPDGILAKDGKPFSFTMDGNTRDLDSKVTQLVQQYWKAIGVDVKLNMLEFNAHVQKVFVKLDFTAVPYATVLPPDPDVSSYFHTGASNNVNKWSDPKMDSLLEQGQQLSDPASRKTVYTQLQRYMADTLPTEFLWYLNEAHVQPARLNGVPDIDLGDAVHYVGEWWLAGGK